MNFCNTCGDILKKDAKFCTACGTHSVPSGAPTASSGTQPVQPQYVAPPQQQQPVQPQFVPPQQQQPVQPQFVPPQQQQPVQPQYAQPQTQPQQPAQPQYVAPPQPQPQQSIQPQYNNAPTPAPTTSAKQSKSSFKSGLLIGVAAVVVVVIIAVFAIWFLTSDDVAEYAADETIAEYIADDIIIEFTAEDIYNYYINAVFTVYSRVDDEWAPYVHYFTNYPLHLDTGTYIPMGSAFFIDSSGVAVTNHHVAVGHPTLIARTHDGRFFEITGYYSYDISNDIAIIQVDGREFDYVTLSDTPVGGGAIVFAIGSPAFDLNTITSGNVSRFVETLRFGGGSDGFVYVVHDAIQFTAPIYGGNSGGALFNQRGHVVGIPSAGNPDRPSVGFAVHIDRVDLGSIGTLRPLPLAPPTAALALSYPSFEFVPALGSISPNAEFLEGGSITSFEYFAGDELLTNLFEYIYFYSLPVQHFDELILYANTLLEQHGFLFVGEYADDEAELIFLYNPAQNATVLIFNNNLYEFVSILLGRENVYELIIGTEAQPQDTLPSATPGMSQIIGEWRATSIPTEPFITAMQHGWMYDEYFFADGTGISWWYNPDTGWYGVSYWTWYTSNGQVSTTSTWVNEAVLITYLGQEAADAVMSTIGETSVFSYSVVGNTLTLTQNGFISTYQRN